jgi:hypothetical protein
MIMSSRNDTRLKELDQAELSDIATKRSLRLFDRLLLPDTGLR